MGDEQPRKKIKISDGDFFKIDGKNKAVKNAQWIHYYAERDELLCYIEAKGFYCVDYKTGKTKWHEKRPRAFLENTIIKNGFFISEDAYPSRNKRHVYDGYENFRDKKPCATYDWSAEDIDNNDLYFHEKYEVYSKKHGGVYMILCEHPSDDMETKTTKYTLFVDRQGKRTKTEFVLPLSKGGYSVSRLRWRYHTGILLDVNSRQDIVMLVPFFCMLLVNKDGDVIHQERLDEHEIRGGMFDRESQPFLDDKDRIVIINKDTDCYVMEGPNFNIYKKIDMNKEYNTYMLKYGDYYVPNINHLYTGKAYTVSTVSNIAVEKRNRVKYEPVFYSVCYDSNEEEK